MKTIIAGSRSITDIAIVNVAVSLSRFRVTEVVSGCARGVDKLGEQWAVEHGVSVKQFPADWKAHGKRAGFIRNDQMAKYADALVAVWDGQSHGTEHMIRAADAEGLKVFVYRVIATHPHLSERPT